MANNLVLILIDSYLNQLLFESIAIDVARYMDSFLFEQFVVAEQLITVAALNTGQAMRR